MLAVAISQRALVLIPGSRPVALSCACLPSGVQIVQGDPVPIGVPQQGEQAKSCEFDIQIIYLQSVLASLLFNGLSSNHEWKLVRCFPCCYDQI